MADIVRTVENIGVFKALVQHVETGVLELVRLDLVGQDEKVNAEPVLVFLFGGESYGLCVEPDLKDFEEFDAVVWEVDNAGFGFEPGAAGASAKEGGVVADEFPMDHEAL